MKGVTIFGVKGMLEEMKKDPENHRGPPDCIVWN
jgi:hypothetical protein